ncbi:MAG: hypothetical protein RIB59_12640 [Rhodospirillales bacterium]
MFVFIKNKKPFGSPLEINTARTISLKSKQVYADHTRRPAGFLVPERGRSFFHRYNWECAMGSTFVTLRPDVPPPPPPPASSLPGARRSTINDTIMTAGPGGAKNPLPGSIAATRGPFNERARVSSPARESLKIDIETPPGATVAAGTDGYRKRRSPLPGQIDEIENRDPETLKRLSDSKIKYFTEEARIARDAYGDYLDEKDDLEEGIIMRRAGLIETLSSMNAHQRANELARRGFPNARDLSIKSAGELADLLDDADLKNAPPDEGRDEVREKGKPLRDPLLRERFPINPLYLKGEGLEIAADLVLDVQKGRLQGLTEGMPKDRQFVNIGGYVLRRSTADFLSQALTMTKEKHPVFLKELEKYSENHGRFHKESKNLKSQDRLSDEVSVIDAVAYRKLQGEENFETMNRKALTERAGEILQFLDYRYSKQRGLMGQIRAR